VLNQTPTAFGQLVQALDTWAGHSQELDVRVVICGGEALEQESVRQWYARSGLPQSRLVNMYGITETTVHVTACELDAHTDWPRQGSPIGTRLQDLQVYVLDERGELAPVGVTGELYVGGAGLARGYLGRPDWTAERFVPHHWSQQPGQRLYRTGDRGSYQPTGALVYVGRGDGQVKLRGYRIEVGEIEQVLREELAVREAVVVLRTEPAGGKRLVGYVVGEPDEQQRAGGWRERMKRRVPEYMLPAQVLWLPQVPLTPSGKLDRRALPAPEQNIVTEPGASFVAPGNSVEEAIAQIWSDVLHIEHISVHANFFELGGHSLFATQIISRVRACFQMEIPFRALFNAPTIAGLADIVISRELEEADNEMILQILARRQ